MNSDTGVGRGLRFTIETDSDVLSRIRSQAVTDGHTRCRDVTQLLTTYVGFLPFGEDVVTLPGLTAIYCRETPRYLDK